MAFGGGGGTEVARFYATIGADTSGLTRGAAAARGELGMLRSAVVGGAGIATGMMSFQAAIQGVHAAISGSVGAYQSYETALVGVRRTVSMGDAEFARFDERLRDMAQHSLPASRNELARVAQIGGQLGISGSQDLSKFVDTIERIAVSTDLTADSAAIGFARLSNLMQRPISDVDALASAVMQLGDAFPANETEILEFSNRMAGAAELVGITDSAVLGLAATLPSLGVEAEAGGTAMQQTFLAINEAVATGGDDLTLFAALAGMTATQFAEKWKTDANGALLDFIKGIGRAGDVAMPILNELGLGGVRTGRSLLGLAQNTGMLERAMAEADNELVNNQKLTRESALAFGTSAAAVQLFKNRVTELGDNIGGGLTNALLSIIPLLDQFIARLVVATENWGNFLGALGEYSVSGGPLGMAAEGGANIIERALQGAKDRVGGALNFAGQLGTGQSGSPVNSLRGLFDVGGTLSAQNEADQNRRQALNRQAMWDQAALDQEGAGLTTDALGRDAAAARAAAAAGGLTAEQQTLKDLLAGIQAPDGGKGGGGGGGAGPEMTADERDFANATEQIQQRHLEQMLEAYVEGGDAQVEVVRARHAQLDQEWVAVADMLHTKLGVEVPETFRLMWEDLVTTEDKMAQERKRILAQIEDEQTSDLVKAWFEGGQQRVDTVRGEQAELNAQWDTVAQDLRLHLGVEVPEIFRSMWQDVIDEAKRARDELNRQRFQDIRSVLGGPGGGAVAGTVQFSQLIQDYLAGKISADDVARAIPGLINPEERYTDEEGVTRTRPGQGPGGYTVGGDTYRPEDFLPGGSRAGGGAGANVRVSVVLSDDLQVEGVP